MPLVDSLSSYFILQEVQRQLAVSGNAAYDKAAEKAEDQRLAAAANFSDEQKRVLVALHTTLYTNLGRLQRRRELLTVELQVSSSLSCLHLAPKPCGPIRCRSAAEASSTSHAQHDLMSADAATIVLRPELQAQGNQ